MTGHAAGLAFLAGALVVTPTWRVERSRRRLRRAVVVGSPHSSAPQTAVSGTGGARTSRSVLTRSDQGRQVVVVVAGGAALGWLLSGATGAGVVGTGAFLAVVVRRRIRGRIEPWESRRVRRERADALPAVLDLAACCLRAGSPLVTALEMVSSSTPGPLAGDLGMVASLLRLGSTSAVAWADYAGDPVLAPVARAVTISAESGSRLADAFERLAADSREDAVLAGEATARRAGVLAMAPLGLCFLPAFVCLGVAPVVLGIVQEVLG